MITSFHHGLVLFPTPLLTAADQRVLAEIDTLRHDLRDRVLTPPRSPVGARPNWTESLGRFLTAEAVAGSNHIDGFRVSTADAVDLIDGERDIDVADVDREATLAYQRMMSYARAVHDAADFSYSKGLLCAMHWMLQGHRHAQHKPAGQWRRGLAYVTEPGEPRTTVYTAPDADRLPGLMAELVEWLNAGDGDAHPLVRAAMAHLNLVSIHPWASGNGLMARSLQTLMIAREGVLAPEFSSIEAWLGSPRHAWEYCLQLSRRGTTYTPDQDVSEWVAFNLKAHHERAQYVRFMVQRASRLWTELAGFALRHSLDERTISALYEAASAGRVRRARYESSEDLSLQQAQRDLRDLVTAGILVPVGRTRARYYQPGEAFPQDVLEFAAAPVTLTDP